MQAADPPPVIAPAPPDKPADMLIVSRDTRSDVLVSADTPLALVRANRREDALLRQAIFLTSTLTVMRPASGTGGEVLRWTYQPYLQRQFCFTSITGQFACAGAEVEDLPDVASGEAPLAATLDQATSGHPSPDLNPQAQAARVVVATALGARSAALFEDGRRLKLAPMLKAAGVSIRRETVPKAAPKSPGRP